MLFSRKTPVTDEKMVLIQHSPTMSWIHDKKKAVEYTPDFWHLQQCSHRRLFVYDEMMEGHKAHDQLPADAKYLATGFTDPDYCLWKKDLGSESWAMAFEKEYRSHPRTPKARIRGELYSIRSEEYLKLDKRMDNGLCFIRKRVDIHIPYWRILKQTDPAEGFINMKLPLITVRTPMKMMKVRAYMYVANQDFWDEHLTDILYSPVKRYTARNIHIEDYYYFARRECGK
jgi:hypothetical protein